VETKYSNSLGIKEARIVEQQRVIARELHLFDDDDIYTTLKLDQIVRNFLLALVYGERHGFKHAINFVLGPAADTKTPKRVEYLRQPLSPQYRDRIVFVSLEEMVERGLTVAGRSSA
jgi:PD-(D/E)XK nuclease superfamily